MTKRDIKFLDEQFDNSLKEKDFETCRKLLTNKGTGFSYPETLASYYKDVYEEKKQKKNAKQSDLALYNLFSLIKTDGSIYKYVADTIIDWHRNRPSENEIKINILIINQIIISLIKYKENNPDFISYAFSLFNDNVPYKIFNSDSIINRKIELAISASGRIQKKAAQDIDKDDSTNTSIMNEIDIEDDSTNTSIMNEFDIEDDSTNTSIMNEFDIDEKLKETSNKYSASEIKNHYYDFLNNREKQLLSISYNAFKKLEKDIGNNKTYCNATNMQYLWFNAAVSYFKKFLIKNKTRRIDSLSSADTPSTRASHDPETDDDSTPVTKYRARAYSLMLIPDKYKYLLFNYVTTKNKEEKDVTTRNIVHRLRSELVDYYIVYKSFLDGSCKDTIYEDYIKEEEVFYKYYNKIDTVCTIEIDNPCFFEWKLLADKLISKRNSAIHNSDYEVLLQKHHYNNNIGTIMNKFPSFNIENIIENWEIYKNGSNYKVKCFKELSSQDQYIIVLSENRELENKIIISYFFNELNSQITESNIKNTVSKWKNIK